ncbi:hypothetical protein CI109_101174 [Kwoniella shandongensis]|uniref:Uncharacterized protein n=1 Tax=Kwoniella shandongensis TaxID=1734106 RepID=A0A5M6C518_9TREE|nr:uncharacterized protein CI109_001643 [Kwoniella shandongensis]KAA5530236.1 hypothetical protein CI109_001643 [Kwoniella shandongensis]
MDPALLQSAAPQSSVSPPTEETKTVPNTNMNTTSSPSVNQPFQTNIAISGDSTQTDTMQLQSQDQTASANPITTETDSNSPTSDDRDPDVTQTARKTSVTSINNGTGSGNDSMNIDPSSSTSYGGGGFDMDGSGESAKRPRLRLAHACDRCRRRKIRCDTQHPCTPCQQSNNVCTFETPSRRTVKPKSGTAGANGTGNDKTGAGSSSTGGVKRPHSQTRGSGTTTTTFASLAAAAAGSSGESQQNLEARLAALESMLRDVPPNVHNAFLSTLDARLGSGTGVGLKEGGGGGDGVGVAVEALAGGSGLLGSLGTGLGADVGWGLPPTNGLNAYGSSLGRSSTLAPDWSGATTTTTSNNNGGLGGWLGGLATLGGTKKREEEGMNELAKRMEGMSFFYEDEIGQAKWQGATSGFPLLDLLTAANARKDENEGEENGNTVEELTSPSTESALSTSPAGPPSVGRRVSSASASAAAVRAASIASNKRSSSLSASGRPGSSPERTKRKERFFPDRTPRPHQTLNPEASWKVITGVIPPDLMDTLVRCYLSTSHLLWPFLHVPSFLADYANPQQWGEPGFTCFIVAVCTLSSRHVDDPRVRANPSDPSTAGKQYFELFKRLRDLPSADRPTLYSIQAAFLAAIYAFGLGNLSKAFALQAESITLCLDGGLHRSVDGYDHFDAIEKETRKRTFWSIYSWDKQSAALFGRPPIIHLRDCDVTEPLIVDDENLTPEGIKDESMDSQSRMGAFVATIRLHVVLEGVIDSATQPSSFPTSPFLAKAAATISRRSPQNESLRDEEALLEEWTRILPKYWHYDTDTANSRDPIRITQAERLHCLEHLVKMIIYRHRFSGFVAMPASTAEERARHLDLCRKAMQCALTIIADHVHISQRGMMTYYGVHVIHQLAQAGRTLVAVILNCRNADFRPIIAPSIEGLRSCVGLLRRFSGRYLCGLRSADIIDEFCRICNIPVDSPRVPDGTGRPSPAWLRPVRKRVSPPSCLDVPTDASPGTMMNFDVSAVLNGTGGTGQTPSNNDLSNLIPNDLDALFNTSAYFDMSGVENSTGNTTSTTTNNNGNGNGTQSSMPNYMSTLGEASAPYDRLETLTPNAELGNGNILLGGSSSNGQYGSDGLGGDLNHNNNGVGPHISFDYGLNGGFGGESLASEGMDNVSDGLRTNGATGLSAATILSLMEEGSFDYGSIFTDQAPLPMDMEGGSG